MNWMLLAAAHFAGLWFLTMAASAETGLELPAFDFALPAGRQGWEPTHHISRLEPAADGLRIHISGPDPYTAGPARDYPEGKLLWMHLRLKSDQAGTGQVFYYRHAPNETDSVRFPVSAGAWMDVQVPLPNLGPGWRMRIDPPGTSGTCVLGRLWFEERVLFANPEWPRPEAPVLAKDALVLQSGDLEFRHEPRAIGAFEVNVAGRRMAVGNRRAMLAYVMTNEVRWVPFAAADENAIIVKTLNKGLELSAAWQDPDGARWGLRQRFVTQPEDAIDVEIRLTVDQDRSVLYLPLFTLLPGVGSFGTNKNQALLPGLEYLENEPSSSEADLTGPASWRQVPDLLKLTFPLMVLQADDRYVALQWESQPSVCAVFDSPDRQFQSGGHLMGLLFPGSDSVNREERSLLPYKPELVSANRPLVLRATLLAGRGGTVIPAVQQFVRMTGLPPVPDPGCTAVQYYQLAARGWLESKIRETHLYRHAWAQGFNPQPSADAALWMLWLAGKAGAPDLGAALSSASADALAAVPHQNYNAAQIGHVHYPLPAAVFGAVLENAAQAKRRGEALLKRFAPDGAVYYQANPKGPDYGKTHWSRDANGLTGNVVMELLEAASFSGDGALIDAGLRHLRAMSKFRNTVPRGAQTWEIPLHTPDILASAYLVRAYTLGYELSGDPDFLDQARYWAWTGVPFVYLQAPTPQPVGVYGTIPVLGATAWVAPVWIGQPVQWCGLVYADALYRLLKHDPAGPWLQLADGITASGIQQTWPITDRERVGLLPDGYDLRSQTGNGPAINPATLLAPAVRLFREPAPYEFHSFQRHAWRVHVPGALEDVMEHADRLTFTVRTWSPRPCHLLINGLTHPPEVKINGRHVSLDLPHQYQPAEGRLVLRLENTSGIEIQTPKPAP